MKQYISKDAILAEIEQCQTLVEKRLLKNNSYSHSGEIAWERDKALYDCYNKLLSFMNSLEVKEVDINKEISQFIDANFEEATIGHKLSLGYTAEHFFELGLKAQKEEKV